MIRLSRHRAAQRAFAQLLLRSRSALAEISLSSHSASHSAVTFCHPWQAKLDQLLTNPLLGGKPDWSINKLMQIPNPADGGDDFIYIWDSYTSDQAALDWPSCPLPLSPLPPCPPLPAAPSHC